MVNVGKFILGADLTYTWNTRQTTGEDKDTHPNKRNEIGGIKLAERKRRPKRGRLCNADSHYSTNSHSKTTKAT